MCVISSLSRCCWPVALVGVIAAVTGAPLAQKPCSPPRVQLHFADPHFAQEARAAVAEVWQLAGRCMDLPAGKKGGVVHVYNDLVACEQICKRQGLRWKRSIHGFLAKRGNVAHALFYNSGWCADARWRIGNLTMRLALRQATRLPEAQWPNFIAEGLTRFAEGPSTNADGWWLEPRVHGTKSRDSRGYVQTLLQQRRMPGFASFAGAGLRPEERNALARHRVRFLMAQHGAAVAAMVRAALGAESAASAEVALRDALQKSIGKDRFAALDGAFAAYVQALPDKMALELHPPATCTSRPGDVAHIPARPAILWLDKNRKSKFKLMARPHLIQIGQGDLVFERRGGRWLRITLEGTAQLGVVTISRREVKRGKFVGWKVLASTKQDVASIRLGRQVDLEVVAERRLLVVKVAGAEVLRATLSSGTLVGRYGVGGPTGNQVAWRSVRLR